MPTIQLSAGPIDYQDAGRGEPTWLLLHGLAMDGSVWRKVVPELPGRVIVPTLPIGSHRQPMNDDADLGMRGHAALIAELIAKLELERLILVGNDWGVSQLVAVGPARPVIDRLVLTSQETFDNLPPGLPGKTIGLAAKVPGGVNALIQGLRFAPLRRLPMAYGLMSKRVVPDEVTDQWLTPLWSSAKIRRDLTKYLADTDGAKAALQEAEALLEGYDRPVLIAWATEDRVMPIGLGRRLAARLPKAELIEISDSWTLIPEDQPQVLAAALRRFAVRI
jgi:pimeloyl-ACP methyl ester carboxylesterase